MQKININLLDILISKSIIFKNHFNHINMHPFKTSILATLIATIWLNIIYDYLALSVYHIPFFNTILSKSIFCYILLVLVIAILIFIIALILRHIKCKTIVNIFDLNMHYQSSKSELVLVIPKIIDHMFIFKDKYFVYQINKQNNKFQLLTIINRNDPYFNEQKFWKTHTTYITEYLKGNLPYRKNV